MFRSPSCGAHFFSPPGHILGGEQITETLKSNGTTTQFWRGSADTANTAGIVLTCVHCKLLLEANRKPPRTAFLICGVVRVGEAFFYIKPKICQQPVSRMAFEPYALPVALHLECKHPTTAPAEGDLDGLVQVDNGAVAAHQETPPDMGTGFAEHDA